ncbi:TPA: hypothetical protein L9M76_005543 [Klebsiella variicola]|nr:Uncharacterised protein [Klebsiella variicola]SXG02982.1 Uncharacterised protein [Klebsiella variicola]HBR2027691.1 hypothetical protein [Klebsiella variicola]HBR2065496.1 hypothetical protein [Klebsiella variicola]
MPGSNLCKKRVTLKMENGMRTKINCVMIALCLGVSFSVVAEGMNSYLVKYGQQVGVASENNKIRYLKAYQTTASPLNAYRVDFNTTAEELMSVPGADTDAVAKMKNLAITKAWETRFCTPDLNNAMVRSGVDMVSGFLLSDNRTQHVAVCFKQVSDSQQQSSSPRKVTGIWYDDVGSPDYLNATLTIYQEGERFYLKRVNGDGSGGEYLLTRKGQKFIKNNDKFGAFYLIRNNKLEIYDNNGFIRDADIKREQ